MTVKELINILKNFEETDEVVIEQEYNSNGGAVSVLDVTQYEYRDNTVLIEGKIY